MNQKEPKKKTPKKVIISLKKRPVIVYGIIAVMAIAGVIGGIYLFTALPNYPNLIIGTYDGIMGSLDPFDNNNPMNHDITSQIAEGLFDYATASDQLIHNLAINHTWSNDYLNLTCNLRQGVKFHDETALNAASVKWNFDRICNLMDLNISTSFANDFWLFPKEKRLEKDGIRILNETQIINDYTIRFILNKPYTPFLDLLASIYAYIYSPTCTPYDDFIPMGGIIGTGPFIYEVYIQHEKIILSSNPSYWRGQPKINKLIFLTLNKTARYEALLTGEISMLCGYDHRYDATSDSIYYDDSIDVDSFFNHPSVIIQEGPPLFQFTYLIMNNELINVTMRKAISYALNYSLIINEIINGHGIRAKSPISEGMRYSNLTDINYPYYNVSKARHVLKDAGLHGTNNLTANDNVTSGNEWEVKANSLTPLATYNFTLIENEGSFLHTISFPFLVNDLKQIGIKLEPAIISWAEFKSIIRETSGYHLNMINFLLLDTNGPKLNDPSTIIQDLFLSGGFDNIGQVNDTATQDLMELALAEHDEKIRSQIYYDIQKHLVEEVFPSCYLYRKNYLSIFRSNLKGWQVHQFKSNYKDIFFY
ncbi:MAG: ABC transporter substrate-binding protein [Promethearchaeota archaeon]